MTRIRRFFTSFPRGGQNFLHFGACSGASRSSTQWLGHVSRSPGSRAPWCSFFRSSGYWLSACAFVCALELPSLLVWVGRVRAQVSISYISHHDVHPSWVLGHGGDIREMHSRPSLIFPDRTFLMEPGAEESTPAFSPLTGRLSTH
jgi:hypothetical protein